MALINYPVDKNAVEESFDVLPAGEYQAIVENSDYVENKTGTGRILKLTYQIIDGPLKGRKIFENLNLENTCAQAQEISRKALNSLSLAVGISTVIKDSSELHNRPLKIDVTVKEDSQYGKQNRIKKHMSLNGSAIEEEAPGPQPVDKKAVKKHPWEK